MLSIQIRRDHEASTISISQHSYINSILHCFNFVDVKPLSTPMDTQVCLTSEQAPSTPSKFTTMHDVPYCEAVGMLNWAALTTHPDIVFAIATVVCCYHLSKRPNCFRGTCSGLGTWRPRCTRGALTGTRHVIP